MPENKDRRVLEGDVFEGRSSDGYNYRALLDEALRIKGIPNSSLQDAQYAGQAPVATGDSGMIDERLAPYDLSKVDPNATKNGSLIDFVRAKAARRKSQLARKAA